LPSLPDRYWGQLHEPRKQLAEIFLFVLNSPELETIRLPASTRIVEVSNKFRFALTPACV
jgi:hypothetical protein